MKKEFNWIYDCKTSKKFTKLFAFLKAIKHKIIINRKSENCIKHEIILVLNMTITKKKLSSLFSFSRFFHYFPSTSGGTQYKWNRIGYDDEKPRSGPPHTFLHSYTGSLVLKMIKSNVLRVSNYRDRFFWRCESGHAEKSPRWISLKMLRPSRPYAHFWGFSLRVRRIIMR